jgi:putative membrane protein
VYKSIMSERGFLSNATRKRAAEAVKAVEAQTSAELVIAVRRRSGDYRAAAYHFGFLAMGVVVAVMLVVPKQYAIEVIALDGMLAFGAGALLCWWVPALSRLMVLPKTRRANVEAAGRAAFYDLGISKTTGRNGILVFVSTFERACAVIPDAGIVPEGLGPGWTQGCDAIRAAAARSDVDAFFAALQNLGPVLGAAMPRAEDDVNELPDEVQ